MDSVKKIIDEDISKKYHGSIDNKEFLKRIHIDRLDNKKIKYYINLIFIVGIFSIVCSLGCLVYFACAIHFESDENKSVLSLKNQEYIESYCDDFNTIETFKISFDKDNYLYIYSGVDCQDNGNYNRIYFYVFNLENDDNSISLYLEDDLIKVNHDDCGIFAIVGDESGKEVNFKIEMNDQIKEYSIDLFK